MNDATKITPDEHSDVVGGSTADRVLHCPGSVGLNQKVKAAHKDRILRQIAEAHDITVSPDGRMPGVEAETIVAVTEAVEAAYREETTSEYAAEGTGLHEAMAWILENDEEPESVVDRTFEGIFITPTLYSEAVAPALRGFDDYCDQVYEEDGEDLMFTIEERCQLPGIDGAFGTSDIIGKTAKRVVIWDWKFGAGVAVSPEDNSQLKFYARAALHSKAEWFGYGDSTPPDDLRIDLVISQPRIGDGDPQVWTTTYADLEAFREELVMAVDIALNHDTPPVSQGAHCKWCEAKHICPAKQQLGQRILDTVDTALDEAPDGTDVKDALVAMDVQFTPDDIADWLQDAADVEAWIKWVREMAFNELKAGREVTGKELDQGLGNASWTVDEKTVDRRLASYGLSVDDRRVVKPITPTAARKLLKPDPKASKLVEKIIERPQSGVKMVDAGKAKNPVRPVSEQVASVAEKLKGKA